MSEDTTNMSKRDLLKIIGVGAGAGAMYQAMATLGFMSTPSQAMPINLEGAPKGASVVVLGAGVAGMVAAYELRQAGYKVKVLEFQDRAGGRAVTIRGGDKVTNIDGETQTCEFDKGMYFNYGPWRIPYHHKNMLGYCKKFGVKMDPFTQLNFNAYLHTAGNKPVPYRELMTDFNGHTSELLAKAVNANKLDDPVTKEDKEKLLAALKYHGALDNNYSYGATEVASRRRGFETELGGGLSGGIHPSKPAGLKDMLDVGAWQMMHTHSLHQFQQTIFEPRGGMAEIGKAFSKPLKDVIQYGAEVTDIKQSDQGVEIVYNDHKNGGRATTEKADWCVCTVALPMLRRMNVQVGDKLKAAINAVPYDEVVKIAAQYKRRFWEQDEDIYGGMTLTNMPNSHIAYPSIPDDFFSDGKGVLMNAYLFYDVGSEYTKMKPQERINRSLDYVEQIHPQARKEYENGFSVAWAKMPWTRGGYALWPEAVRQQHYKNLCEMDGRVVLAGEHTSYMSGWFEGAVTSSLDAITRVHEKAVQAKQA